MGGGGGRVSCDVVEGVGVGDRDEWWVGVGCSVGWAGSGAIQRACMIASRSFLITVRGRSCRGRGSRHQHAEDEEQ